jgi:photosystem II stability/assembly factor-like uncharacterized protein
MHRPAVYLLLAGALHWPAAQAVPPTAHHEATAHDALFGLCLEGDYGISVGANGLVLESRDGGNSWRELAPFTQSALLDVSCDTSPRLMVGQQGMVFREQDGAFQAVDSGTDARLLSVDSNADGLAMAVGGFGTVLRSSDGGRSWETLPFDWEAILNDFLEPHLYDVDVAEDGVITIVGEFELVLRSEDGGDTWETTHKGEASLFALDLQPNGRGYAVGQDGRIVATTDGGVSWSSLDSPAGEILLDVWSDAGGKVYISGIRTMLRSDDGGGNWTSVQGGDLSTGWYQQIVVPDDDGAVGRVLMAGHRGKIISLDFQ